MLVNKICYSFNFPKNVREFRWREDDRDTGHGRCKVLNQPPSPSLIAAMISAFLYDSFLRIAPLLADDTVARRQFVRDCRVGDGPAHTDPKPERIRDRFDTLGEPPPPPPPPPLRGCPVACLSRPEPLARPRARAPRL